MSVITLEAARVNAHLTQSELAVLLGVSKHTIMNWESGKTEPSITQARKLCDLSGIPIDLIFIPDRFNLNESEERRSNHEQSN